MNNSIQDIWNHNLEQVRAWVNAFKLVLRRKKNIKCDQMGKNDEKQEKTAKITIFRLIYSYFSSLWAWISLWLSISISSILWRRFWMVICIRKTFYRILTIENRDRMSQIRPKSGNNGSKTKTLPIFFVCNHQHSLLDFPDAQLNETPSWKYHDNWIKTSNFVAILVN